MLILNKSICDINLYMPRKRRKRIATESSPDIPYPKVRVEWIDCVSDSGWATEKEFDKMKLAEPIHEGWLYEKNKKYIKNKYFLMLLPDDLIIKKNCSKSMIKVHKKYQASVMASMKVKKSNVSRWGVYKINKKLNKRNYVIDGVVEKPSVKKAPSNNAVIGRYILPRKIFKKIKSLKPGKGKEIHITDAIQLLINDKEKFIAHNFEGKYLDCGTMSGYINSSKEIGKI